MKAWSARVALLYGYLSHAWMRLSAAFPIASPAALAALRAEARTDDFTPSQFFPIASAVAAAMVACILPPARFPGHLAKPAE